MSSYINCNICGKKYNNLIWYKKHIETKHLTKEECKCDSGGCIGGGKKIRIKKNMGKYPVEKPLSKEKMNKIFKNAETKLDIIADEVHLEALLTEKSQKIFNTLPLNIQNKIKKLLLENEYLKGMVKSKNSEIKQLQKSLNKCINKIGNSCLPVKN